LRIVEVYGLPSGFNYELAVVDGQLKLQALNDVSSLQTIFLPAVAR
jgi:hypothetical protein